MSDQEQIEIEIARLQSELACLESEVILLQHQHGEAHHRARQIDTRRTMLENQNTAKKKELEYLIQTNKKRVEDMKNRDKVTQSTDASHHTDNETQIDPQLVWPLKLLLDHVPNCISPSHGSQVRDLFRKTGPREQIEKIQDEFVISTDIDKLPRRYDTCVMMLSYCREESNTLRESIQQTLYKNIHNEDIDSIVVYVSNDNPKIDVVDELLGENSENPKLAIIEQSSPATYTEMFAFIEQHKQSLNNACFIMAKPDVELRDVNKLKNISATNRVICISEPSNRYWQTDAWMVDGTVTGQSLPEMLHVGCDNSAEKFLANMHISKVEIRNISVGGHVMCSRGSEARYVHKRVATAKDNTRQWPFCDQIEQDNYIVGDVCASSKYNFYYTDRYSGIPSNCLVRNIKELTHTHTNEMCVFFMTCDKEIKNGCLYRAISNIFSTTPSIKKSFNLHICVDSCSNPLGVISNIKNILRSVEATCVSDVFIENADLTPEENVFTYDMNLYSTLPQQALGASNGINKTFYDTMQMMQQANRGKYKNMLMFETDCTVLKENWFDTCVNYCRDAKHFAIAGSKYSGIEEGHRVTYYAGHLNGVAIYKNCEELTKILKGGKQYIKQWISNQDVSKKIMNFDVGNYMYVKENAMEHLFIDVDFISNYSSVENTHLTTEQVLERHPDTVILHKKYPSS